MASSTPNANDMTISEHDDPIAAQWQLILQNTLGNIHAVEVATRVRNQMPAWTENITKRISKDVEKLLLAEMRKEMPAWVAKMTTEICKEVEELVAKSCKTSLQDNLVLVREAYEREVSARSLAEEELRKLRRVVHNCPACASLAPALNGAE